MTICQAASDTPTGRDRLAVTGPAHPPHMDTSFDIECPWCAGHLVALDLAMGDAGEALACSACSIVVELAPDPVTAPIALAA